MSSDKINTTINKINYLLKKKDSEKAFKICTSNLNIFEVKYIEILLKSSLIETVLNYGHESLILYMFDRIYWTNYFRFPSNADHSIYIKKVLDEIIQKIIGLYNNKEIELRAVIAYLKYCINAYPNRIIGKTLETITLMIITHGQPEMINDYFTKYVPESHKGYGMFLEKIKAINDRIDLDLILEEKLLKNIFNKEGLMTQFITIFIFENIDIRLIRHIFQIFKNRSYRYHCWCK
ncbi:MAG: hypothetical protein Edafosvirus22_1, partial [Edafosvirus sp.]